MDIRVNLSDQYEILRLLGEGKTGKVYLARNLHLNRLVAVKESTERFLKEEAELLLELEHSGLPGIYDCIRQNGKTFLVMEYVEGMTLRQYLEKHKKVQEEQAVRWTLELCNILDYLHRRRPPVIYRDLKPENIMIRQDGTLKLIDLGGAVRYARGAERKELCVGTPGYAPEEQWTDPRGNVGWDIYGIGTILWELLTGENPVNAYMKGNVPEQKSKEIPRALREIIQTCRADGQKGSYQTIRQVEEALLSYPLKRRRAFWIRMAKHAVFAFTGGYALFCFLAPLLEGVPESHIPFPYLFKPLMALVGAILVYLILFPVKKRKQILIKQEKNILLTGKKFPGLFVVFFFLAFSGFSMGKAGRDSETVYAAEEEESLWVEMRDEQGRKMLLKYDAVYQTKERVQFEIPAERLPHGQVSLQIIGGDEEGKCYSSRIFLVQREEN